MPTGRRPTTSSPTPTPFTTSSSGSEPGAPTSLATERQPAPSCTAVYLARYLNIPPARLPGEEGDRLEDLPTDPEAIHAALLDTLDHERQVDAAARLVARHLTLGYPPHALIAALGRALLREDAGFHAY